MTARRDGDRGSAVIEFVFVALTMFVPLLYLLAAVAVVQRSQLAVTDAAREAGRAFASSDTVARAPVRAAVAMRLALAAHGVPDGGATVRIVAAGDGCDAVPVVASLVPGTRFTVCVTRRVDMPGIPSLLRGRGITAIGVYTVHVDDFRSSAP